MKLLTLKFIIVFIYLISSSSSYAIQTPNLKNLVIHKEPKKLEKINFKNINNENINLNKFKDSLIIINFWATWCAPCIEEMPSLNSLLSISIELPTFLKIDDVSLFILVPQIALLFLFFTMLCNYTF